MITDSVLYAGLVLVGIGTGAIISSAGGWHWLRGWFVRNLHGERALPGLGTGPLNVLPEQTPADWTPLLQGSVDDTRRRHGRHETGRPRITEQTVPVAEAPGHAPWSGSFPAVDDEAEAQREHAAFVRSQLPLHEEDVTQGDLELALALLRERTAANLPPVPAFGLSFDCGNGLHAPVCDGRNCSCSCHGKTYGETCQADVEAQERLARGLTA